MEAIAGAERAMSSRKGRTFRAVSPNTAQRILALDAECRSRRLRCVFLTQPTMWREGLPPEEQELLWFGWVGQRTKPDGYMAVADLARAMDLYNRGLLDVCQQRGMECYDLASAIPPDTSAFFDDCHFNVSGARMVAQALAEYMMAQPPFAGYSRASGDGAVRDLLGRELRPPR